ncbi:hypothetical protein BU15DRAFT_48757 [Melanogaster broomeanus]|nr:hypothetical protein BU15DRAFT_48757 [Melanogaster broomeanus]
MPTTGGSANKALPSNLKQAPQILKHKSRHRSYSDPFSDPIHPSKPVPRLPPEPPPKYPHSKMATTNKLSSHRDPTLDALRDTVTVQARSSEQSSRSRSGRPQTSTPCSSSAPRPTHGRRSMSQDSVLRAANALEKAKGKPRGKKGSVHADVIDRLDFSGVGPMFHHDGPFDACAPSRNRHRTKAPMLAWNSTPGEDVLPSHDSPYPSPDGYKGSFSPTYDAPKKRVDAIAEAWGIHEPEPYEEFFAGGGTARRDGETPSNSIYAGREGHGSQNGTPQHSIGKRSKDGRDLREVYREYLDDDMRQLQARDKDRADPRRPRRTALPPPQPIMVPLQHEAPYSDVESGPGSPSGAPKRTRSLMQRIRKMRDSPNVPMGYDDDEKPSSPTSNDHHQPASRPTHRSQNSFLGRFVGGNSAIGERRGNAKENASPMFEDPEAYVYIDDARREKQLPATPGTTRTPPGDDKHVYFDGAPGSPGSGGGLGRRTSLMKKVKDVVRGPK